MPTLYFNKSSDYEMVVKLREEVSKLEGQLLSMNKIEPPSTITRMEKQLASIRKQMMELISDAAQAGAYFGQALEGINEFPFSPVKRNGKLKPESDGISGHVEELNTEIASAAYPHEVDLSKIFEDLDKFWKEGLEELKNILQPYISGKEAASSPESSGKVADAYKDFEGKVSKESPFKSLIKSLKSYKTSLEQVAAAREDVDQLEKNGTATKEQLEKAETKLTNAQNDRRKSLTAFGTELKKNLGKMQEMVDAGKFLSGALSNLSDTVGNDGLKKGAEYMNAGINVVSSTMSGMKAGAALGPWGAAAGAAIGFATSLGSSLAKFHDAKFEKRIQKIQKQIERLDKSYKKLEKSIQKAYSSDASELIGRQNELLEKQKSLIQNQIEEEKSKKKTDNDKILKWQDKIEELNDSIQENKEKQIDAIFGRDVQSAIDDFAQSYVNAWASGEDKARSMKNVVKNMIKGVITEMIKSDLSAPVAAFRQKIREMLIDNIIDTSEQAQLDRMIENLTGRLNEKYSWTDKYLKDDKQTQEAASKGFQSMSQDTAEELNGRFTAIQSSVDYMRENNRERGLQVKGIAENMSQVLSVNTGIKNIAEENRSLIVSSYLELQQISANTKAVIGPIRSMAKDIQEVKRNTSKL